MAHALQVKTVRLRTLGRLNLTLEDGTELDDVLSRPKEFALIVYLAMGVARGESATRDSLLPLFWPELSESRARHALRQMLYSLRRRLGTDVVRCRTSQEVGLDPELLECDAGELLAAESSGDLEQVVALYRGEFLAGFHPGDVSAELEHWIEDGRGRLRRTAVEAAQTLAGRAESEGVVSEALRWSRRAVEVDPLSEEDVHRLVRLLGRAESAPIALETYERYRLRLEDELDIRPGEEIQREVEAIRARLGQNGSAARGALRPALAADTRVEPVPPPAASGRGAEAVRRWWQRPVPMASWILMLAGLVIAMTLALASNRGGGAGVVPAAAAPRLAIVPLPGPDGDPTATTRMAYAAAWGLSDAAGLRVVDPGTLQALLRQRGGGDRRQLLRALRAEMGADMVLTARPYPEGGSGRAMLELWDPRSDHVPLTRGTVDVLGPDAGLADVVGSVRQFLRASLPGADLGEGAPGMPATPEALDAYVLGDTYLYRGEPRAAIQEFERAVAADGDFAQGWHRLSVAAGLVFDGALADSAADRAGRAARRLPHGLELLIEARRAYRRGLPQEAETALRALLALYPDDIEAQHQLAEVLMHFNAIRGRPVDEALPLFRRAAGFGASRPEALYHMAQLTLAADDTTAFRAAAAELLSLSPAAYRAPQMRILLALADGDRVRWRRELARLASDADFTVLSSVYNVGVYGHSPEAAAEVARLLTDRSRAPETRAFGYETLADLALARGRPQEAWRFLARAAREQPAAALVHHAFLAALPGIPVESAQLRGLAGRLSEMTPDSAARSSWFFPEASLNPELPDYLRALLGLKDGRVDDAARLLRSLARAPLGSTSAARLYAVLSQRYRLSTNTPSGPENDPLAGVRVTAEQAVLSPLYSSPDLRYLYALEVDRGGNHRLALRILASLDENSLADLVLAGPARLAAAGIHEKLGERDDAVRLYRSVLDLWSDAEPAYDGPVHSAVAGLERLGVEPPAVRRPPRPTEPLGVPLDEADPPFPRPRGRRAPGPPPASDRVLR